MQTIRSFIAIRLSPDVEKSIANLIRKIKEDGDGIKWVPTDNLHLTLKFLGDVDNVEVPKICDAIRYATEDVQPFDLHFVGTGGLPSLDRPRVLHVGVKDLAGMLCPMVEALEIEMAELGFKREPRDYRPHLTIGRSKGSRRKASEVVLEKLGRYQDTEFGAMVADEIQLIGSFLDKQGPTYHVMDTIDL